MHIIAIFDLGLKKPFAFFDTCSRLILMMNSAVSRIVLTKCAFFV